MSRRDEVREFLISRRANVTPEQAGLPDYGSNAAYQACGARKSPSWPV